MRNRHDVARGRIRICRGAFPALPFPAEMFHVITAFEPAFWAGDLSACLREIRRLLRPGGQCVLVCLPPLRLRRKGRVVLHWLQPACDLCRPMPLDVFPAGWAQAC